MIECSDFALRSELTPECYQVREHMEFVSLLDNGDIVIIREGYKGDLFGYSLGASNYILLDNENKIAGILLQGISPEEVKQLSNSNAL